MVLSARNNLPGTIAEIQWGDVVVHVTVRVGDHLIESVITRRSAEEMARTRDVRPTRADRKLRDDDAQVPPAPAPMLRRSVCHG